MKNKSLLIVAFALLNFLSCKKEEEGEKVTPSEYFPAYPGSYWKYSNNKTMSVLDGYETREFDLSSYSGEQNKVKLSLPMILLEGIYNGGDTYAFLNGNSLSKSFVSSYRDPMFKTLFSTNEGEVFGIGGAYLDHQWMGKTLVVDTTITIGSVSYPNVIVTIQYEYSCSREYNQSPESCATIKEYYGRGVGLLKRERRNPSLNSEYQTEFELLSYYIAR
ncbi:MAG: hypothetical protein ACK4WD_03500 [Flavobacteriales bacterium]|jgi:hypothetical protein